MEDSKELKLLPGVTIRRRQDSFDTHRLGRSYNLRPDNPEKFQLLTELLEKGKSKAELEKELEDDLEEILSWMKNKRLIANSGALQTQDDSIIAADAGYENLEEAKNLIKDSKVGLIGIKSLKCLFDEKKLEISDIGTEEIDVVVALSDNINSLLEANRKAIESETPILHIWPQNNKIYIGPFVMPTTTACGRCLMERMNYNPGQTAGVKCELFELEHFKPVLKQELYRYLGKSQYPKTRDKVLELDISTIEKQEHSILKVPDCEHCGQKKVLRG